eukprot:5672701-Amphidinium_carterae.1
MIHREVEDYHTHTPGSTALELWLCPLTFAIVNCGWLSLPNTAYTAACDPSPVSSPTVCRFQQKYWGKQSPLTPLHAQLL